MKIKTETVNGVEYAVLKDGNPVYVHADGKEIPFDAPTTVATITRLNGEAKSNRERAEGAESKLKTFEGITDVTAALSALDTVSKIKDKKLLEAGEVDKVRAEAKKAFDEQLRAVEDKYAPIIKERDTLQATLVSEKVGGAFARSKFIAEKLAIPADMVQARFGADFKLEGEAIVAYDKAGNKIFSRAKPGEVAGFEEAMEIMVDSYPYKDHILKGAGASGGGASGGGGQGGKKTLTRTALAALDATSQHQHFKNGGLVVDG